MSPDFKTTLVQQCPVCLRPVWANSLCHHGQVPPPSKDAPKEEGIKDPPVYKPRTRDKK